MRGALARPGAFYASSYRAPVWLYRLGLGWLLGESIFLLSFFVHESS